MTHQEEQAIARDLELIDIVLVLGDKRAKRAARKQRKICFAALHQANQESEFSHLTDDELLRELGV